MKPRACWNCGAEYYELENGWWDADHKKGCWEVGDGEVAYILQPEDIELYNHRPIEEELLAGLRDIAAYDGNKLYTAAGTVEVMAGIARELLRKYGGE